MKNPTFWRSIGLLSALLAAGCGAADMDMDGDDQATLAEASAALGGDLVVYADALGSGWQSWSWSTTINTGATAPVKTGASSLAATYNAAWAGLYLHTTTTLDGADYSALRFSIHGGATGGQVITLNLRNGSQVGPSVSVPISAGQWTDVQIPLSNLGSPAQITGVVWQESSGGAQPTFYLDDITFLTSAPPPPPPPALSVNASAGRRAISPDIYGINNASEDLADAVRLPVRRWGGNATSRYNYLHDTANRGADWYFENVPEQNANPAALPTGSKADRFVEQDRSTGARTLMTMPLIGWTPKARAYACGFSVASYGAQQSVDPWRTDCGNGVLPGGADLTGNDPTDTSVAITPSFVQGWINHLISRFGTAAQGGVAYYNLDNEPMLWNDTHRDVHPAPTSYDEIRDRTYDYAAAIKGADPSAKTLGPVAWGWEEYFYSALDKAPGGSWWNNPQDRNAHGGVAFVPWYLQQMQAYEQQHSVRILDYLDLHYYPAAAGVPQSPAGDADTQAKRLRSTRSLWDPSYVDESWIGQAVRLIPRMREWVDQNYPGTKLAVSEYNFGALDHINGALAQADVLGIFGREGVDLATLWWYDYADQPTFEPQHPGAFAFRMYRDYDGTGGAFGETSVQASSTDQGRLSVYAAERASDGALTLMIVNKSGEGLSSPLTLSGFSPASQAQVYRYSAASLGAIVREADQPVTGGGFTATYPANSVTLVVVPSAD